MSNVMRSLLLIAMTITGGGMACAEEVDLLLVLASDVSRALPIRNSSFSVKVTQPPSQIRASFRRSGQARMRGSRFALWNGRAWIQKLLIDWTSDADTADTVSKQLLKLPRSFADRTSISEGLAFAMVQLGRAPFRAKRRTIDVAGDGTNNAGRNIALVREDVLRQGISINGLVILSQAALPWNPEHTHPPGGLDEYYRRHVIGGPGLFLVVADGHEAFARAIVKKMTAEIAWHAETKVGARTSTAGERVRGYYFDH